MARATVKKRKQLVLAFEKEIGTMLRELIHYRFEEWGDGAVEAFAVAVYE